MRTTIVGMLLAMAFISASCEKEESANERSQREKASQELIQEMLRPNYEIALLSVKYGIPEERIGTIINQVGTGRLDLYRLLEMPSKNSKGSDAEEQELSVREKIKKCSEQLNIPETTIASILIDLRAMTPEKGDSI